jgi:hypothetical protein
VANPRDGSFGHVFSFGTASAAEQRSIDAAAGAMILCLPVELHTERARIAGMAEALASRGALAVRIEESKLGYPIDRWTELVGGTDPWSLYRAAVVVLEDKDGGGAATCGMQVFSLPDADVAFALRGIARVRMRCLGFSTSSSSSRTQSCAAARPSPLRKTHRNT